MQNSPVLYIRPLVSLNVACFLLKDNLWGPAPAVNPPTHRTSDSPSNQVANDKKKKAVRKNKGGKMDATALLGFTVGASSHRLNVGEIEKAE